LNQRICPNCDVPLRPVTAHARSGYLLSLDQCGQCGGLWCDRWELYPIDACEVNRLDPVDQSAVLAPVATVKRELKCPCCHTPMQRFRDPLLPEDVHIERCPACEGIWLNRGELRRFKEKGAPASPQRSLPNSAIQELVRRYATNANWSTVSNLQSATSTETVSDEEDPEEIKGDVVRGVAWLALRVLMRLLLHI
jgi:Zn-finger nucleic acid-binding protein